jgi:uncharacterized protein YeaO (DUF488 family)
MIQIKRVYDPLSLQDGVRYLVDRVWPRGKRRDELHMEAWLKDVSPSLELCRWFGHDPQRWDEFRRRYYTELDRAPTGLQAIREADRQGMVTLLYSARDTEHNNAVALRSYLELHAGSSTH